MTSHNTCAVLNCKRKQVSMFTAPNPKYNWDLFVGWWKATGNAKFLQMEPKDVHSKLRICEAHFKIKEVTEQLKRKIKSCIPSLNLPAPLKFNFGINYEASIDTSIPKESGLVGNEEVNKENAQYSRKRSSLETGDNPSKSKRILRETDITNVPSTSQALEEHLDLPLLSDFTNVPSTSQAFMEDLHVPLLSSSTTNTFRKRKPSGKKSPKLLRMFQVTRKKHLSPTSLAIFKETGRLKRKIRRLQHLEFENCNHKDNIEAMIFVYFTKLFIFNYVKKLNNILSGKANPENKNHIEEMCFETYKRKMQHK